MNAWTNVLLASSDSDPDSQLQFLQLVLAALTDCSDVSQQRQLAVSDDAEVTGCVLDSDTRRQNAHMGDVKLRELLTRTQPHDLGFDRVQSEPTGSQPGLDIG